MVASSPGGALFPSLSLSLPLSLPLSHSTPVSSFGHKHKLFSDIVFASFEQAHAIPGRAALETGMVGGTTGQTALGSGLWSSGFTPVCHR